MNQRLKQLTHWAPEIYLFVSVIYYWIMSTLLNPIPLFFICVLAILVLFKNRALGIIISTIFLLLNLYMVLALASELGEFPTFNKNALTMLLVGGVYLGLNIFFSIRMLIKWTSSGDKSIATS